MFTVSPCCLGECINRPERTLDFPVTKSHSWKIHNLSFSEYTPLYRTLPTQKSQDMELSWFHPQPVMFLSCLVLHFLCLCVLKRQANPRCFQTVHNIFLLCSMFSRESCNLFSGAVCWEFHWCPSLRSCQWLPISSQRRGGIHERVIISILNQLSVVTQAVYQNTEESEAPFQ